jgi:transposase
MNKEQSLFPMIVEANNHEVAGTTHTRKQRFKPYDQQQTYLLPSRLDDYVGKYHIARLVSALIDHIDISCIIEGYKGGASAYDPRMLLKVWILGYLYKIYTVRPLERALTENVVFIKKHWGKHQKV